MINQTVNTYKLRYYFLIGLFCVLLLGLISRLAYLHVFERAFLQHQGDARSTRTIEHSDSRGIIQDRNGEPLAISTVVKAVWINPKQFAATQEQFDSLINILGVSPKDILAKLTSHRNRGFLYLKRNVIPTVIDQVLALKIPGLYVKPEYKRYYPTGEVNAHVLGMTNIDDRGQEGIELAYDEWLTGAVKRERVVKDLLGRPIALLGGQKNKQSGGDLTLSIDQRLQYLAYRELKKAVEEHKATSGSVVVLHVPTGEVLAMVNQPSFNPNIRSQSVADIEKYRNRAVTDYFEPGSAIKAFSMASVLEHTNVTANTMVNTAPGFMVLKGGVVRDHENYGLVNVTTMLQHSSNVGVSKLVLDLPDEALWDTYDRMGFGFTTGSNFPGENAGTISSPVVDRPFVKATMAFGYGLGVTSLQLARAYAILGSGGIRRPVNFLKTEGDVPGVRVLSSRVARDIVDILSNVVEGDASNAKVPGYHVAGKTGTARKLGKDGYQHDKHLAVFGGIAPAVNAKFAIVVTINEPSVGKYYGNQVAAPVFANIAAGALRLFDVSPDLIETQGVQVAQHGSNRL